MRKEPYSLNPQPRYPISRDGPRRPSGKRRLLQVAATTRDPPANPEAQPEAFYRKPGLPGWHARQREHHARVAESGQPPATLFPAPALCVGAVFEINQAGVRAKACSAKAAEVEVGQRPMPPRTTPAQRDLALTRRARRSEVVRRQRLAWIVIQIRSEPLLGLRHALALAGGVVGDLVLADFSHAEVF